MSLALSLVVMLVIAPIAAQATQKKQDPETQEQDRGTQKKQDPETKKEQDPETKKKQDPEKRFEALEREVRDLRREVRDLKEKGPGVIPPLGGDGETPTLQIGGFGHLTYSVMREDPDGAGSSSTNEFAVGGLDIFLSSQISERLSFLSETQWEYSDSDDDGSDSEIEIHRLILKYECSDQFNFYAGRFHTLLGYWNETFHHGEFLQTNIGRPAVLGFRNVVPIHTVGVGCRGSVDTECLRIECGLEVGNGRGPTQEITQNESDENDSKRVNVSLRFASNTVDELYFGGGFLFDEIPRNKDAAKGPVHGSLDEKIGSAYLAYVAHPWEVMVEYYVVDHSGTSTRSNGWFAQCGHRFGDFTPYARYDHLRLIDSDPYWRNAANLNGVHVGVRWDMDVWTALKLEVFKTKIDGAGNSPDQDNTGVAVQWSFAF